jgi:DNA-binding NtrC family response regulator
MAMLGSSPGFLAAKARLVRFSTCDEPILIEGETGTGKELAARAVHYSSDRRDMPFVPVNCGSLPDGLVENEFFGHARGAFTDARDEQPGLVALAHRGTLFLDEIDTLSGKAQVFLLRFLQDGVYRKVGSTISHTADVRIVAATNASLAALSQSGIFRSDLLFRLRVLHVRLPPLRERPEDVPELAEHFLRQCAQRLRQAAKTLDADVLASMQAYPWPGNVRELENMVWRAFLLAEGPRIGLDAVPELAPATRDAATPAALYDLRFSQAKAVAISQFEAGYLARVMGRAGGNVTAAAKLAGTERRYLGRLLKKHGLAKAGRTTSA